MNPPKGTIIKNPAISFFSIYYHRVFPHTAHEYNYLLRTTTSASSRAASDPEESCCSEQKPILSITYKGPLKESTFTAAANCIQAQNLKLYCQQYI